MNPGTLLLDVIAKLEEAIDFPTTSRPAASSP
jgi:hypothetical protein